ncbi:bifunctional proline dehydrogenase/L-glutamate gamma-semialdehyde dehydrogenase PutA [Dechloromonas sp. XY25]|uniref:Bifunctional protein PutA n=1 Tax=Dechloromonas hankyongensis TaxID=2908002 RepID=A0ABS9K4U0_9RHOO|nr:bifunctional proline dehydrogenase/L-glutamate gamma-semialdehyde dehydrogenase PutA [Dechloromonas hankyongensis]MCG2578178.1 bifunctional proline dehydrogenase/L-glutamate gamma-semialdehyde dehydrogenase PutA [Dechloromonas hankyongensis]
MSAERHTVLRLAAHRAEIARHCRSDEQAVVAALAQAYRALSVGEAAVARRAEGLVKAVRAQRRSASGVDHLMHEFSLSSQEGIALMCLAEALLRIPDSETMDRLIRDKISRGDWRAHVGHSGSLFVNAAAWGLMITGSLVATHREDTLGSALSRLIARGGEPLIRRGVEFAMTALGQQFVMGESIEQALERSRSNAARGFTHSFDMLGEAALTARDAERYGEAYAAAIHAIGQANPRGVVGGDGISVKLSALHPRFCRAQRQRVMDELYPRLLALAALAADYRIGFNIDAEEADRLSLSLELVERLAFEPALAGWEGLGVVVQAYQKRALPVIDHLAEIARLAERRMMIRLVKGAYWDSEIKRAQVDGLAGYPVFTRKAHTDLSYLVCAARLLAVADVIYPQFATHNAHTLACVERMAGDRGVTDYEFQCLHGMGEALYGNVVGQGDNLRCRIYAPVGRHETLLPYLVRRLLENGANTSFVNRVIDEKVSIDELVASPLLAVDRWGGAPHPAIPLPADLYGAARRNSSGIDLSDDAGIERLTADLARLATRGWKARPLLAGGEGEGDAGTAIGNPAQCDDVVGLVHAATAPEIEAALASASAFAPVWAAVGAGERARLLRACADCFEAAHSELISLCIREAGKTWGSAIAEIREAVDFCRYYAAQIETLAPAAGVPGVVVCISPWNFPLAIFVGEVVAALAAGSPVLAKPAEQTPLIAAHTVRLMRAAGIPAPALQLLPGAGEIVGARLTGDHRVQGVIFTGSTEVARIINRSLAQRPVHAPETRLIAETGGQNAMIVDSSAQIEQAVQDVIVSGFDSAGQRCSALRVLCVQEDIADCLIGMLQAAMDELRLGDPGELATDVGPVIDESALAGLRAHIAAMRQAGQRVHQVALPPACAHGCFMPPTLIEIDSVDRLQREVFGPVVHVLRFAARDTLAVVDAINATGYGLTFGMHSRIDESIAAVTGRIRAGNRYINRNMVGAVVGVQPFGGEGLSGTGPKAGGPFYLPRLLATGNPDPVTLGLIRDPADARLAALADFAAWARQADRLDLLELCEAYAGLAPLGCWADLPGPTGECNRLDFWPRGEVFCLANDEAGLLRQIAAVLATGNTPVVLDPADATPELCTYQVAVSDLLTTLPVSRSAAWPRRPWAAVGLCAAVLHAGDPLLGRLLHQRLAAGDGALVPVLTPQADGGYALYRLLCERVLTVNTTAAGGNASLMAQAL